jgi:hypothetical protein
MPGHINYQSTMIHIKQIAYKYIQACQVQACYEDQVATAFQLINSDNQVYGLADPILKAYRELVVDLLGPQQFEWLEWWQYETDYGKDNMDFKILDREYTTEGMTLLKFLDIVLEADPWTS